MFSFWKELYLGNSLDTFAKIRGFLYDHNFEQKSKVVDRNNFGALRGSGSLMFDKIGENQNLSIQYYIYVKSKDYETASYLIRKNNLI